MPRLSVWFVRASLLYLLVGFAPGALILAEKGVDYDVGVWTLLPVHMEFLLMGWLLQLALGVAFWILPRFGVRATRGSEGIIWVSFVLLNVGILLVALQVWIQPALLAGRACEIAGIAAYMAGSWRRIKPLAV